MRLLIFILLICFNNNFALSYINGLLEVLKSEKSDFIVVVKLCDFNIDDIFQDGKQTFSVVITDGSLNYTNIDFKRSLIIFCADYRLERLSDIIRKLSPQSWFHNSRHIIVATPDIDKQKLFSLFWKEMVADVILLEDETNGRISAHTFYPFTEKTCYDTKPIKINEFDCVWSNDDFFPSKFKNLHRCPLKVVTYHTPPAILISKTENDSLKVYGFEGELLQEMAHWFNMSLDIEITSIEKGTGYIYANGWLLF